MASAINKLGGKKLSDNLNWIDKSSSGTYHKYALCTRVWKWLLKQAPHCATVIFLRPLIIYISRQSQPMTATEMIIRVNLNFDLYFVSAQGNDNFCSVLLNQGLLNRWTSQLDLGCTTGGLERVVSVHNST